MKNRSFVASAAGFALLGFLAIASADPASQPASADWPQWRGPTRDGIAPAGPKLLDAWPKEGPKLQWKSEPIPFGYEAGYGSVVVADSRVFLYVNRYAEKSKDPQAVEKAFEETIEELSKDPKVLPPDGVAKLKNIQGKFKTYSEFAGPGGALHPLINSGVSWAGLVNVSVQKRVFDIMDEVICLDAATGKQVWAASFPAEKNAKDKTYTYFGGSGTPAISGGRCYVQGSAGLYCLDSKNGKTVWQVETTYSNASPMVLNGVVYATCGGGVLFARSAETGQLLWKVSIGGGLSCDEHGKSVVPWKYEGKDYLVGLGLTTLFCVDPKTGTILWQVPGGYYEGSSTPSVRDDLAVFRGNGGVYAFKITPQGATQLWKKPPGAWRSGCMLLDKDCVFDMGSDFLRCLDAKTGEVKWMEKESNHYSSPVLVEGKVICPTGGRDHNSYTMFRATSEKFEVLGLFGKDPKNGYGNHIGAACTSPAIADGKLYLRCFDLLHADGSTLQKCGGAHYCVACYDLTEAGNK